MEYGFSEDCIQNVVSLKNAKPYYKDNVFFNKSHSGGYVICALSAREEVGIDIEEKKIVDLQQYKDSFHPTLWQKVLDAEYKFNVFYDTWTQIESVIKGDGRGMQVPTNTVLVKDGEADLCQNRWYLTKIHIAAEYSCHLATPSKNPIIELIKKEFTWLFLKKITIFKASTETDHKDQITNGHIQLTLYKY